MKTKLRDYIDSIFADAPLCAKTIDLKDEMYRNVCDRYDDLIAEGKSESAAYNICIAGIGDVSEIIDGLRSERGDDISREDEKVHVFEREYSPQEQEKIERYRMRSEIMNAIAIALYILCWVPLVLLSEIGALGSVGDTLGVVIMVVMIAAATVLMCMKSAIKPSFMKRSDDDDEKADKKKNKQEKKRRNPLLSAIHSCIWVITMVSYFVISFSTGYWHITWLIFLISAAADNIVDAIFELVGKKHLD